MSVNGLDGLDAYGAIPVSELGKYQFVGRYVAQQPGKCITPDEATTYLKNGKSIVLVYEDNPEDALGGANVGLAKAKIAKPILTALGVPQTVPVHFAVDMPGYSYDLATFIACAKVFALYLGRPAAIYGDVDTCTYAHEQGIRFLWQFGEGRAPGVTIYQSPATTAPWGQAIDPDESLAPNYGQWLPKPPPRPVLARSLTGRINVLGRAEWNTTLDWSKFNHATVADAGPKATVWGIDAGGHTRIRVAKGIHGRPVHVNVYTKGS